MDAIGPYVDVTLRRQIAPLPRGVFVKPTVLKAADSGCRQPGSVLAEQRRQSCGEGRKSWLFCGSDRGRISRDNLDGKSTSILIVALQSMLTNG
jgi:hypothetical protein